MRSYSLQDIIKGLKSRDEYVLKYIYKEHYSKVLGYVLKNGGNEDDAKDFFQESIIIIYKLVDKDELKIQTDFGSYLVGVAKRLYLLQIRDQQIHNRYVEKQDQSVFEEHPADEVLENELQLGLIRKYIVKLGEDCRKILMWSAEGISNLKIAEKLKFKTEHSLRTKKYKCKQFLLKMIKKDPVYRKNN